MSMCGIDGTGAPRWRTTTPSSKRGGGQQQRADELARRRRVDRRPRRRATRPVPLTVNGSVRRPSSSTSTPSASSASITPPIGRTRARGSPSKRTSPSASAATGRQEAHDGAGQPAVDVRRAASGAGVTRIGPSPSRPSIAGAERGEGPAHEDGVAGAQRAGHGRRTVGERGEHERAVGQRLGSRHRDDRVDRARRDAVPATDGRQMPRPQSLVERRTPVLARSAPAARPPRAVRVAHASRRTRGRVMAFEVIPVARARRQRTSSSPCTEPDEGCVLQRHRGRRSIHRISPRRRARSSGSADTGGPPARSASGCPTGGCSSATRTVACSPSDPRGGAVEVLTTEVDGVADGVLQQRSDRVRRDRSGSPTPRRCTASRRWKSDLVELHPHRPAAAAVARTERVEVVARGPGRSPTASPVAADESWVAVARDGHAHSRRGTGSPASARGSATCSSTTCPASPTTSRGGATACSG